MLYDVIILGAGVAGMSAGLYASRENLKVLIIEKEIPGGQITTTETVDNYPGSIEQETGKSLSQRMHDQAARFGCEFVTDVIISLEMEGETKTVHCEKTTYYGKTLIIATGATPSKIGCPGEKEYTGRGVGYCATCDAPFYEDMDIYVVGGGDSAVEEAVYLTKFGKRVYIIHRRNELRASKAVQEKAFSNPKIEFLWNSVVEKIEGDMIVNRMTLRNVQTGEIKEIKADPQDGMFGIFVFIGYDPATELFTDKIELDDLGYIITDENMLTNISGVFAAGDIRRKTLRQAITAASDGAIAAVQAGKYLDQ